MFDLGRAGRSRCLLRSGMSRCRHADLAARPSSAAQWVCSGWWLASLGEYVACVSCLPPDSVSTSQMRPSAAFVCLLLGFSFKFVMHSLTSRLSAGKRGRNGVFRIGSSVRPSKDRPGRADDLGDTYLPMRRVRRRPCVVLFVSSSNVLCRVHSWFEADR